MSDQPSVPPPQMSNYPRPSSDGLLDPTTAPPGVYFEFLTSAWAWFRRDMAAYIGAAVIGLLIASALLAPFYGAIFAVAFAQPDLPLAGLLTAMLGPYAMMFLAMGIFTAFFSFGVQHMALTALRGGTPTLGDFFFPLRRHFASVMILGFLVFIPATIISACTVIGGYYLIGRWMLAPMLIVEGGRTAMDALRESWARTADLQWMLFGLQIVVYLIQTLGALACFVGLFFTWPLGYVWLAMQYRNLVPELAGAQPR